MSSAMQVCELGRKVLITTGAPYVFVEAKVVDQLDELGATWAVATVWSSIQQAAAPSAWLDQRSARVPRHPMGYKVWQPDGERDSRDLETMQAFNALCGVLQAELARPPEAA